MEDPCKESEPQVIDHGMITRCLDEQGLKGELGRLAREEGIPWEEVSHIRMEFMHIIRVDHLWVLPGLTTLSLSNNLIENIQNLHMLVNLKELDLSFNKIKKIENLDDLVNLEIVNFFNNLIEQLENMDNMKKLMIFSVGNNKLVDRTNLLYLRRFKTLKSVNMAGNPCTEGTNFRTYVAIFLPNIVYYEYRMIDQQERDAGKELYAKELVDLEVVECVIREREEKIEHEIAEAEIHSESFVELLDTGYVFDQMFENDAEGKLFLVVDEEAKQYYSEYMSQFIDTTKLIFENGMEQYRIRKEEVAQFLTITEGEKLKIQEQSIEHMEVLMSLKDEVFKRIRALKDKVLNKEITADAYQILITDDRDKWFDAIHKTWKTLMGIEMTLFEQIEETNQTFEQSLTEMINNFVEMAQGYFSQIRGLQNNYSEMITEMCVKYLTNITIAGGEADIPPNLAPLFNDRDCLNNALAASHDTHLLVIDNREDRLVRRAHFWLSNLVNNLQKDEIARNRSKVLEINHYLDIQKADFEEVIILQEMTTEL